MVFKLVRIDSENPCKIVIPTGKHLIGRGRFLNCEDKRISRTHGELEVSDDCIIIKALHMNPCFVIKKETEDTQILKQNCTLSIQNGDRFGLLPNIFWFEVLQCAAADVDSEPFCSLPDEKEDTIGTNTESDESNQSENGSEIMNFNLQEKDNSNPGSPSLMGADVPNALKTDETNGTQSCGESLKRAQHPFDSNKKIKTENSEENADNNECNNNKEDSDEANAKDNSDNAVAGPSTEQPGPSGSCDKDTPSPPPVQNPVRRERCMYGANCYRSSQQTRRRLTYTQLQILWKFLNENREIAVGFNKSAQDREHSKRLWKRGAVLMNSTGEGAIKSGPEWSKYWIDLKAKLKRKNRLIRDARSGTGGGPFTAEELSDIEVKFLELLGGDNGSGVQSQPSTDETDEPIYLIQIDDIEDDAESEDPIAIAEAASSLVAFPGPASVPEPSSASGTASRLPHSPVLVPSPDESLSPEPTESVASRPAHTATGSDIIPPRRRKRQKLTAAEARERLVAASEARAQAELNNTNNIARALSILSEMMETLKRIERKRNAQHKAQYSHPSDGDWGEGDRGECPWGASCRRRDPRHWRDNVHPPGAQPPNPGGKRRKRKRRCHSDEDEESGDSDSNSPPPEVLGKRVRRPVNSKGDWDGTSESEREDDPFQTDEESDEWQPDDPE